MIGGEGTLLRIELRLAGEDPRIALRDRLPDENELASIVARLARIDTAAKTAWTMHYLQLIAGQPAIVSYVLARQADTDVPKFKRRIRQLKELGLAESLEIGYRLSPRGHAYSSASRAVGGEHQGEAVDVTDETNNEQAALWNGPAGRAWVDAQDLLDRVLEPFQDLLVDTVAADSDDHVLDVGCGTGSTTLAIARRLGAKGSCVGVDISDPMLALARARAEREGIGARFIHADAQLYAFEPARFDTIVSRFGVMFFDDPVEAFANLRRAAKSGARLHFIAWRSAAENPFMTTGERAAGPLLPNMPPRKPDAPGQFAFANRDRVHSILQESGWSMIDIQPIDVECRLPESELVRYATRLGPVGMALQEADDQTRVRVTETVCAAFAPFVHGEEVRFNAACWMASADS